VSAEEPLGVYVPLIQEQIDALNAGRPVRLDVLEMGEEHALPGHAAPPVVLTLILRPPPVAAGQSPGPAAHWRHEGGQWRAAQ
jgi:hypothetical protein